MIFALSGTFAHAESGSLVVLGDSITTGYGLDGYTAGDNSSAAGSFANQLSAGYAEYGNFAVDGRTSGELLTALEDEDVSAALAGAETVVISIRKRLPAADDIRRHECSHIRPINKGIA